MKYNKPVITVYPGKKIKLILRNNDDMHHNLAITKRGKGKDLKVAQEAWKLGAEGFAKHWIPDHPDLLFSTKMADPHSSATLYFTAPKKTGKYPNCTISDLETHILRMQLCSCTFPIYAIRHILHMYDELRAPETF